MKKIDPIISMGIFLFGLGIITNILPKKEFPTVVQFIPTLLGTGIIFILVGLGITYFGSSSNLENNEKEK